MGRKKIVIKRLTEDRNRNVTFLKRKHGLLKKAWELSVLCGAEVSILIFSHNGKCYEFSSGDLDGSIDRYHAYSGPIERRRAPEFAAMAENGGKDDGSDIDEDDPSLTAGPGGAGAAGGEGSVPKGMSLKGKEEWKDVSLARNAQAFGTGGEKQEDSIRHQGKGGPSRGRGRTPQEVKGKTREVQGYPSSGSIPGSGSSAGSVGNPVHPQGQGSNSMASSVLGGGMSMPMGAGSGSRTVTGSWTGQNGGYHGDERGYERSDVGFQDERNVGYHERVPFYPPHKQPSMYSLYQQRDGLARERNDLNASSSSYRSDNSRYPPFDGPAPSLFGGETQHSNSVHMTPSSVHHDPQHQQNQQAYAQYSLPVDHGINADGSIDWNKATAAAQLQAALHAQQAQLAYLRQQRQQQEHWRELLAATAGGNGSLPPGFGTGLGGAQGGAMMGDAVQRFNELVAAGHDPMNMSGGFQWPTHAGGAGQQTSSLGLSTHEPGDTPDPLGSVGSNPAPDWFSEPAAMRSSGMPNNHSHDLGHSRSPNPSRPVSPADHVSGKRSRQDDELQGVKRARMDSGSNAGLPSSDSSG